MNTLLENILPISAGLIWLVREVIFFFAKRKAYQQGRLDLAGEITEGNLAGMKSLKEIHENNEKLTDDELDDQLASGVYAEKRNTH